MIGEGDERADDGERWQEQQEYTEAASSIQGTRGSNQEQISPIRGTSKFI
jgi:hypothetical protein